MNTEAINLYYVQFIYTKLAPVCINLTRQKNRVNNSIMATLVAPPDHSPVEDAESLRKAVKGQILT